MRSDSCSTSARRARGRAHTRLLVALAATGLLAAACGGDDSDSESVDTEASSAPAAEQPASTGESPAPVSTDPAATTPSTDADADEPAATTAGTTGSTGTADHACDAPDEAENQTMTIALAALDDQIPDPHLVTGGNKNIIRWNTFDHLVTRDVNNEIIPGLATDWSVSDDNLTWTFTLRPDVKFHDGSTLTSADVVTAIERVKGPDFVPYTQFNRFVTGAKAIDDLTVEVTTSEPYPTLATDAPPPIPTEYYNEVGDAEFRTHPMGTGPFKFVSQELNSSMTFERFDDFWDDTRRPNFKTLVLQIAPEESSRVAGLQTGAIDIAHAVTPSSAEQLEGAGYEIIDVPSASTAIASVFDLYTPENETLLTDVRVRRALLHAIDRQGIADALYGGYATVPVNVVAPPVLGYDDSLEAHEYDPDLAKQLLEEAGASDLSLVLHTYSQTSAIPEVQKLAQAVVGYWQQVGVDATLDVSDPATYLPNYRSHAFTTGLGILGLPTFSHLEPNAYATYYTPTGYYSTVNDPELAALMDEIATTVDRDERAAVGTEFANYIYDQLPSLPMVSPSALYALGPNVACFEPQDASPYAGPFWYLRAN